ncbi:DUF4344 domain-containing metallopeptidase [Roseibium sp.]|uniref:DUF4344 domain-containing metallopeptidase n=1 Tax=Roseibium sp. TaxID=1936156 RepID=UPI003A972194
MGCRLQLPDAENSPKSGLTNRSGVMRLSARPPSLSWLRHVLSFAMLAVFFASAPPLSTDQATAATREELPEQSEEDQAPEQQALVPYDVMQDPLLTLMQGLDSETSNELFVFVAGNSYFAVHRQMAKAVISSFALSSELDPSRTLDEIAAVQMSSFSGPGIELFLSNGLIGRFALQDVADNDGANDAGKVTSPETDELANRRLLCLLAGSDMIGLGDLALDLGFPADNLDACPESYLQAHDLWQSLTAEHRPANDQSADPGVKVILDTSDEDPLGLFIKESGLLHMIGRQIDKLYQFPEGLTLSARRCGTPRSYWDAETREVVLCEELLASYAWGFVSLFLSDTVTE